MNEELTLERLNQKITLLNEAGYLQGMAGLELVKCVERLEGEIQELKAQNAWLRKAIDNLLLAVYGPTYLEDSRLFD